MQRRQRNTEKKEVLGSIRRAVAALCETLLRIYFDYGELIFIQAITLFSNLYFRIDS